MSTKYVLALDQGTTSSRAILFDNEQNIIAVQQREFEQIYPQQGWVEHNPMEIWSTQYALVGELVELAVEHHDLAILVQQRVVLVARDHAAAGGKHQSLVAIRSSWALWGHCHRKV